MMLTGSPPFEGEDIHVITKHLTSRPPTPSSKKASIPPEVDALVLRLLDKKPGARGASADTVAEELEALAVPPRNEEAPRSSRGLLLGAGGVVVVAALGAVAFAGLRGGGPPPPPPPLAPSLKAVIDWPREQTPIWIGSPVRVRGHLERRVEAAHVQINGNEVPVKEDGFDATLGPETRTLEVVASAPGATEAKLTRSVRRIGMPAWYAAKPEAERPRLPLPVGVSSVTDPGADGFPVYCFEHDGLELELVYVPAGEFRMGCDASGSVPDDDQPEHMHPMPRGYFVGRYEVTWTEYFKFCDKTHYPKPSFPGDWKAPPDGNHPVVNVSWDQCGDFCRWAGLRLPTEAEWEKAARGTDGRKFPWGDGLDVVHMERQVNIQEHDRIPTDRGNIDWVDGWEHTAPTGSFPEDLSPYGAYDMGGNAAEFCEDWHEPRAYHRYKNGDFSPPKETLRKVVRGGSWGAAYQNAYTFLRVAHTALPHDASTATVGFRVALSEE